MGSGMLTSPSATFISEFFEDYIRMNQPRPGGTKTEAARNQAEFNGRREGLAMGLSYYANELRREKIRKLNLPEDSRHNWVPALTPTYFTPWMGAVRERWDAGTWKEVSDKDFMALMTEEFLSIVFDDDWDKYYKAVRKDAIKAGLIEPSEADREWIHEELMAYREMAGPLEKLATKLSKP